MLIFVNVSSWSYQIHLYQNSSVVQFHVLSHLTICHLSSFVPSHISLHFTVLVTSFFSEPWAGTPTALALLILSPVIRTSIPWLMMLLRLLPSLSVLGMTHFAPPCISRVCAQGLVIFSHRLPTGGVGALPRVTRSFCCRLVSPPGVPVPAGVKAAPSSSDAV